ncbi:hypothetical protein WMY93_016951 [Mugilogobius chulae]|uniref:Uncharacterized protein n=1 Tax=Mugilogobius chulae TaxID=88201 RepID=A0AAW0NTA0_9GOBI
MQEVQACEEKKIEKEAKHKTQEKEVLETEIESKVQIRDENFKTEKAMDELSGATEHIDEDHLKSKRNCSVPQVALREVREDGSQQVINDHVTTAGFNFNNSLLFELD